VSSRELLQRLFDLLLVLLLLAGCGGAPAGPTITSTLIPPTATPTSVPPTATPTPMPLDGTEWVLILLNGRSLIERTQITLNFEDGFVSGSAGCNWYDVPSGAEAAFFRYMATEDGTLTIPGFVITEKLCDSPEGDVMEQEDAYIEALRSAAVYRVVDDRPEIDNAAGETTLVFLKF
jgi:heat shock protein HslJ